MQDPHITNITSPSLQAICFERDPDVGLLRALVEKVAAEFQPSAESRLAKLEDEYKDFTPIDSLIEAVKLLIRQGLEREAFQLEREALPLTENKEIQPLHLTRLENLTVEGFALNYFLERKEILAVKSLIAMGVPPDVADMRVSDLVDACNDWQLFCGGEPDTSDSLETRVANRVVEWNKLATRLGKAEGVLRRTAFISTLAMTQNTTSTVNGDAHHLKNGQEMAPPTLTTVPDQSKLPAMLAAPDLARLLKRSVHEVRYFLEEYCKNPNPQASRFNDCVLETPNPRRNEPKFLFRTADVLPALLKHFGIA
jgi:hypothetical protein